MCVYVQYDESFVSRGTGTRDLNLTLKTYLASADTVTRSLGEGRLQYETFLQNKQPRREMNEGIDEEREMKKDTVRH